MSDMLPIRFQGSIIARDNGSYIWKALVFLEGQKDEAMEISSNTGASFSTRKDAEDDMREGAMVFASDLAGRLSVNDMLFFDTTTGKSNKVKYDK